MSESGSTSAEGDTVPGLQDPGDTGPGLEGSELGLTLRRMGVKLGGGGDESMEKCEELCQNVLIILFTIMWKGIDDCDSESWRVRLIVLSVRN